MTNSYSSTPDGLNGPEGNPDTHYQVPGVRSRMDGDRLGDQTNKELEGLVDGGADRQTRIPTSGPVLSGFFPAFDLDGLLSSFNYADTPIRLPEEWI